MRALAVLSLGLLTGCETLLSIHDPKPGAIDGGTDPDAGLPASSPLLLSEVVLAPTAGEMIEIVNPSKQDVDLSTYYLSDSGTYFALPFHADVSPNDFIAKFPAGAKIGARSAITIAIDAPGNFATTYGKSPDFSLMDGTMQTIAVNGQPTLTNEGEPIILFQWDGSSDLVRDVDIMLVGVPSASNDLPNKSGVSQDGPDSGNATSAYAVDRRTIPPQLSTPGPGTSTKRILLEAGHEVQDGTGNGPAGDDETSENTAVTWDTVFTPPSPGLVPPELTPP